MEKTGKTLKNKEKTTKTQVLKALGEVIDPELGISIVKMNLIKEVLIREDKVKIKMTLTTPFCPFTSYLMSEVKKKIETLQGVKNVEVELV